MEKKREKRNVMFWTVTFLVILGFTLTPIPRSVGAQEEEDVFLLEDTLVTATKTGQTKLQETPISISAFSDDLLKDAHSFRLTELSQFVPNSQFEFFFGEMTGFIRGIGSITQFVGGETNIGFYLDGVYLERGLGGNVNFFDVERVEVLRGPQGTLYGRNTTGGAVNIVTKMPSDKLELKAGVLVGDYSHRRVDLTVSGPLIKDKVKARLSFSDSRHDGYVENRAGSDLSDENYTGFRGAVEFTPTEKLDVLLRADYYRSDTQSWGSRLMSDQGMIGMIAAGAGVPSSILVPDDFWVVYHNDHNMDDTELWGISGDIELKLPHNQVLRSITSYREYDKKNSFNDFDATVLDLAASMLVGYEVSTFTQELQLNGIWERLKWLLGFYYLQSETDIPDGSKGMDFILPGLIHTDVANIETDAWAFFGNSIYAVTDRLSFEAGARYSYEEKELDFEQFTNIPFPFFPPISFKDSDDWDSFTWKVGANYRITDEALLYGIVGTGFKSGTFIPTNPPGYSKSVDPEDLTSYEIGIKSDWFNKRLRANGAVFYYDYKDMQVESTVGPFAFTDNAAESTIKGAELEIITRPIKPLTLNGSISYLDSEYDEYIAVGPDRSPVDASGNPLQYAPEWKFIFGALYTIQLGDYGFLTFRGDLTWTDEYSFTALNEKGQDAYTLINGLVRYETASGNWSLEIFGKNLGEEEYLHHAASLFTAHDVVGTIAPPRTFGFQVVYNY